MLNRTMSSDATRIARRMLADEGRRRFLKGAGLASLGVLAASSGTLATINNGAKAQGEPIPLGSGVPITGWAAADGIEYKRANEMACDEINAMGGILGRPVEPVFVDTKEMGAPNIIPAFQRLIDRHNVHAIINGYNTGAVTAEYDTIADAGIIYIHHNTDIVHHETVGNDPETYFGVFMGDPAEYWYGPGLLQFLNDLEESGKYEYPNKNIALVTGSQNYSVTIAQAIRDNLDKYGWIESLYETVVIPISEWGPTLQKLRNDPPAVIAITHWVPQDLAQFCIQFTPSPTNSLVYMQYGPSLAAFREIGGRHTEGVLYSTVVAALQDEIGNEFGKRYKARFGENASHLVGALPYDGCHMWAIAAALAGGTGEPGNFEQNQKVADRLRNLIYRGTLGTTAWMLPEQAARPYPDATRDPSLGMPHQYLQIQDWTREPDLIAPSPYETSSFKLPPWIKA